MNKALTFVSGISFATLLVGVGFVLGALAEMRYQENEGHDFNPDECAECAARQKVEELALKRTAGYPGFTE